MLRAQAARIAGIFGRRVIGTIVSGVVVIDTGIDTGAGSVGRMGDDRPQDADAEPEAPGKAATAELNWSHDCRGRRAQATAVLPLAVSAVAAKGAKATASANGHRVHFSMGLLLGP